MTEQRAHPQRVRRPPVIPVTVKDQRGVPRDPLLRHQPREARTVHIVAGDRIVELGVPVELHRARDMAGLIQQHVLVGLGNDKTRVLKVPGQPPGRDEHFRPGVVLELRRGVVRQRHGQPPPLAIRLHGRTPRRGMLKLPSQQLNVAAALSLPHLLSRREQRAPPTVAATSARPAFLAPDLRGYCWSRSASPAASPPTAVHPPAPGRAVPHAPARRPPARTIAAAPGCRRTHHSRQMSAPGQGCRGDGCRGS